MTTANPLVSPDSAAAGPLSVAPDGAERLALARELLTDCFAVPEPGLQFPAAAVRLGIAWLMEQGIAALVWHRWRGKFQPGNVAEFVAFSRAAYYAAVGDDQLHRRELQASLAVFNAHGLSVVAFKGAALAHLLYPESACRGMSDLDFWIRPDQIAQAQHLLEELGYRARFKSTRPLAFMIQSNNELPLYGTRPGQGLIELHWGVFPGEWLRYTACVDDEAIWTRTRPIQLIGQSVRVLDEADSLIQICVHHAINHNVSIPWLRSLVDITLLARHAPLDWPTIVQRAREWRVATATWLVLSLAVDLCGLTEAAEAARQLAPSRVRQKLIGLFANAKALVDMRDLSKSRWRYVYLLLMVDRKRDAVKLVYRALWPEDKWLQARYGRAGVGTRLRHLLDAARGKI